MQTIIMSFDTVVKSSRCLSRIWESGLSVLKKLTVRLPLSYQRGLGSNVTVGLPWRCPDVASPMKTTPMVLAYILPRPGCLLWLL